MPGYGRIVILNGAPRSGKSSIVAALQARGEPWMNLGVDVFVRHVTPPHLRPGIGLRPGGGERPDIEALLPSLFGAFFDAVAAHSRHGLDVAVDIGLHDGCAVPFDPLREAAQRLDGLPAWLIGVHCPLEVVVARREASPDGGYAARDADGRIAEAVDRWQTAVHRPGVYDLRVDTAAHRPEQCAASIARHIETTPPSALPTLRSGGG